MAGDTKVINGEELPMTPEDIAMRDALAATPMPPPPSYVDPNARLDAGIDAAIGAAEAVRNAVHAINPQFTAANFQAFLTQAKALTDAFVAMLEAQQGPPPATPAAAKSKKG